MSVVIVHGHRFVAGLVWLERGGAVRTVRNARRFECPWFVHYGRQTGFADRSEEHSAGLPSLAAALREVVSGEFWMALVEGQGGRYALVQVRDGAILADGEQVFDDRAAAVEAFERFRRRGAALYATPGIVGGAVDLDVVVLPAHVGDGLEAAPFFNVTGRRVGQTAAAAAVVVLALVGWSYRDDVVLLVMGPPPAPQKVVAPPERVLPTVIDGVALVAGCRRAMVALSPWLAAWRLESMVCAARFNNEAVLAARPGLRGRPTMLVKWRLLDGRGEALHRQAAQALLSRTGWYASSVVGNTAWAVAPLAPVARAEAGEPPGWLRFRRDVDRRFSTRARLQYVRGSDRVGVRITTGEPLARIAALVGGLPGFEVTRLSWRGESWLIEGRRAIAEPLQEAALAARRGN